MYQFYFVSKSNGRMVKAVGAVISGEVAGLLKDIGIYNVERKSLQVHYRISDSHRDSRASPPLAEM